MSLQWARMMQLTTQAALGKSTVVPFVFTGTKQQLSGLSNLELRGNDECPVQLSLTLTPPKAVPSFAVQNPQNISTFFDAEALPAGFSWSNPVAIVEWGIGGTGARVVADIAKGLVLNLCASYVRVQMAIEQIDQDTGDAFYQLSCFIGPGRPKSNNAQKTIGMDQWAAAVSNTFDLPAFAKEVSLVGVDAAGFAGTVNFFRGRNLAIPIASLDFTQANARPQPIPNGAMYFNVKRTSADKASAVSAIFNLSV